jgi:hypothetical protein
LHSLGWRGQLKSACRIVFGQCLLL